MKGQSSNIDRSIDQSRVRSVAKSTENAQTMPEKIHANAAYIKCTATVVAKSEPGPKPTLLLLAEQGCVSL